VVEGPGPAEPLDDSAWGQEMADLDTTSGGWRAGLERWSREQYRILMRHPWLERIRLMERAGTPSQIAALESGLRALTGTGLTEHEKAQVLLILDGYIFWEGRLASDVAQGAMERGVRVEAAVQAFGALLRQVIDPDRFPALHRAAQAGFFEIAQDPSAEFEFGLGMVLDGVGSLIRRRSQGSRRQRRAS